MKVSRRGKPSKVYLDTLRSPTRADYEAMVTQVLAAIITGEKDVLLVVPYTMKFPADFPKGILAEKEGATNTFRAKAKKLLRWLNDHGHTDITMDRIRSQQIAFGLGLGWIDNILEGYEETTT